ncbi:hypothetical protein BDR07DRAFT_339579 [Suillus spraguei]|nr:hypothetical protein BDR07DRAFT_339579 [Suillus spraguei]
MPILMLSAAISMNIAKALSLYSQSTDLFYAVGHFADHDATRWMRYLSFRSKPLRGIELRGFDLFSRSFPRSHTVSINILPSEASSLRRMVLRVSCARSQSRSTQSFMHCVPLNERLLPVAESYHSARKIGETTRKASTVNTYVCHGCNWHHFVTEIVYIKGKTQLPNSPRPDIA